MDQGPHPTLVHDAVDESKTSHQCRNDRRFVSVNSVTHHIILRVIVRCKQRKIKKNVIRGFLSGLSRRGDGALLTAGLQGQDYAKNKSTCTVGLCCSGGLVALSLMVIRYLKEWKSSDCAFRKKISLSSARLDRSILQRPLVRRLPRRPALARAGVCSSGLAGLPAAPGAPHHYRAHLAPGHRLAPPRIAGPHRGPRQPDLI